MASTHCNVLLDFEEFLPEIIYIPHTVDTSWYLITVGQVKLMIYIIPDLEVHAIRCRMRAQKSLASPHCTPQ